MLKSLALILLSLPSLLGAPTDALALTRVTTPGTGEASLLYWRYLCRGQPQEEIKGKSRRELSCPSQRWKVSTKLGEDRVTEVIEDAS